MGLDVGLTKRSTVAAYALMTAAKDDTEWDKLYDDLHVDGSPHLRHGYSGFHTWRQWLASHAGVQNLDAMAGFWCSDNDARLGGARRPEYPVPWPDKANGSLLGSLVPLLSHSDCDCDGDISPDDARLVLGGLEIVLSICEDTGPFDPAGRHKTMLVEWIAMCRAAADSGHWIDFH